MTFTYTGTADPDAGDAIAANEWDLDGDGSFERTTTTATTTRTYSAAGTVAVKLRVVDLGHERSAVATHDVVVSAAPAPEPGGSSPPPASGQPAGGQEPATPTGGGGGGGGDVATDVTAPAPTRVRIAGGRLRLTLDEAARLDAVLRRGTKRVRSVRAQLAAGARSVRLGRLRPGRYTVRFTLTDASGNRTRARTVRFRVR